MKAPVAGWTRFQAAQEWLDRNYPPAASTAAASAAAEVPRAGGPPNRDDPLYREFLEWRANRTNANRANANR